MHTGIKIEERERRTLSPPVGLLWLVKIFVDDVCKQKDGVAMGGVYYAQL